MARPSTSEGFTSLALGAVAYPRKDLDRAVIWFPPDEHDGIRSSIATSFPCRSHPPSGRLLSTLPLELLHRILLHLDLRSLFRLRRVSTIVRHAVSSLPYYGLLVSHGLSCFCALLRTRLAEHISLPEFYAVLCHAQCSGCGAFGPYVFLPTWTRACYLCVTSRPEFIVRTPFMARKLLCMYIDTGGDNHDDSSSRDAATRDRLHTKRIKFAASVVARQRNQGTLDRPAVRRHFFRIIPGTYGIGDLEQKIKMEDSAVADCHVLGQGWYALGHPVADDWRSRVLTFAACCAMPLYDPPTRTVDHGVSCAGCRLGLRQFPVGTCQYFWAAEDTDVVYLRLSFRKHVESCAQARELWKAAQAGIIRKAGCVSSTTTGRAA